MLSFLVFRFLVPQPLKRVLSPWWFRRVCMPLCGVRYTSTGVGAPRRAHVRAALARGKPLVYVSNHASNFDPIWFNAMARGTRLVASGDFVWFWEWLLSEGILATRPIYTAPRGTKDEKIAVRDALLGHFDTAAANGPGHSRPLLIYPEGCVNNTNLAILQFQRWVFGQDVTVMPVALDVWNPWPVNHYAMGAGPTQTFLWFLFLPMVCFRHQLLPPMARDAEAGEDATQFAGRTQEAIGAHLGVQTTNINYKAKDQLAIIMGIKPDYPGAWRSAEEKSNFVASLQKRGIMRIKSSGGFQVDHALHRKRSSIRMRLNPNAVAKRLSQGGYKAKTTDDALPLGTGPGSVAAAVRRAGRRRSIGGAADIRDFRSASASAAAAAAAGSPAGGGRPRSLEDLKNDVAAKFKRKDYSASDDTKQAVAGRRSRGSRGGLFATTRPSSKLLEVPKKTKKKGGLRQDVDWSKLKGGQTAPAVGGKR